MKTQQDWTRQLYFEAMPYDLCVTHRVSENGYRGVLHIHDVFELLLVLSDDIEVCCNQQQFTVPRNSLLLFNNMDLHCTLTCGENDYERYVLYFFPEKLEGFSTQQTHLMECFYRRPFDTPQLLTLSDEQMDVVLPYFKRLLTLFDSAEPLLGDELLQKLIVSELLIYVNRFYLNAHDLTDAQGGREFNTIYTILQYISENYQRKLLLSELAQQVYLSDHYLCRLFKRVMGVTPMEYVTKLRIVKAKELLLHGCSVEETCTSVGYINLSHFSRQFREHVGISPCRYARINR